MPGGRKKTPTRANPYPDGEPGRLMKRMTKKLRKKPYPIDRSAEKRPKKTMRRVKRSKTT